MPRRIHHRLPLERYADHGTVWFVTIVTRDRRPILTDDATATLIVDTLEFLFRDELENILLYVVMPDHIHLLVTITQTQLTAIVQRFKSWTSRKWNESTGSGSLWQESFHDKGVRQTEDIDQLVSYALNNPVRRRLVAD